MPGNKIAATEKTCYWWRTVVFRDRKPALADLIRGLGLFLSDAPLQIQKNMVKSSTFMKFSLDQNTIKSTKVGSAPGLLGVMKQRKKPWGLMSFSNEGQTTLPRHKSINALRHQKRPNVP